MTTKSKTKKTAKAKPAKAKKATSTAKAVKKTPKVMKSPKFVVSMPSLAATGFIVSGTDPCTCGDSTEEHGRDPKYPGSTACTVEGCDCVAYEADREFNDEDD